MGSPTKYREIQGQGTKKTVFMAVSPVGASFPLQKYRHPLTLSGGKLWRMDYRYAGKRKTLSFGARLPEGRASQA